MVRRPRYSLYLDGAHTPRSVQVSWPEPRARARVVVCANHWICAARETRDGHVSLVLSFFQIVSYSKGDLSSVLIGSQPLSSILQTHGRLILMLPL